MRYLTQSSLVIILICISFWGCNTSESPKSAYQKNAHKYALLVGIDRYKNVNGLRGCKNDVKEMKKMLIDKFSFSESNITTLLDNQATHASIINAFLQVISNIDTNATFIFEFSGHGSQEVDITETEANGLKEILIPYDYDFIDGDQGVYGISDDELHGLIQLASKKTNNITVVLDACHSAGATRNLLTKRSLDNIDIRKYRKPLSFTVDKNSNERGLSGRGSDKIPYVLIAGCASEESAYEYAPTPDNVHGILTHYLLQGLYRSNDNTTYSDLMNNVKTLVAEKFDMQHPVLGGANVNARIFGTNNEGLSNSLLVSPSGAGMVKMQGGRELGITENSIFDIYPPGTKEFPASVHPVGKIKIKDVRESDCDGLIIEGQVKNINSLAIEREHNFKNEPIYVAFKGSWATPGMSYLKNSLLADYNLTETNQENAQLIFDLQNAKITLSLAGRATAPVKTFNSTIPGIKDSLASRLTIWSKWFNVLSIENPATGPSVSFSIFNAAGAQKVKTNTGGDPDTAVFHNNDSVYYEVYNNSDSDLYFYLIDLVDNGTIHAYYLTELTDSPQAANELIPAHKSWKKGRFAAVIENNGNKEKDILKLFGTKEKDLKINFLLQQAVDNSNSRGLFPTIDLFQFSSRGVRPPAHATTPLSSWVIVDKIISINN